MGNCVFKGFGAETDDQAEMVKVMTSSGGIMELYAPITASTITDEFPGHAIFRSLDLLAQPLLHNEELHPHELYHLLPLNPYKTPIKTPNLYHQNSGLCTPYRMSSCDSYQRKKAVPEAFPEYGNKSSGVWKVNLVISPEELSEILSQGARTEELIDSARTVAKCGSTGGSSVAGSEQWSTVSSRWKEAP
ncbi:hypothetical protein RchiOBHm_Chr1g0361011 [Rosa chinensis]|uniref:Uncharacterized protein n=1 Tax=Rosa chinensis TaxID=74649 RepID=A0A2P6SIW5_ROSCH|nr:uncharacterized protein LOC112174131 [Rosa chinensis]PRQ58593.1 hypothetical protein RchiOBHm_Chr1g0361011 [Rosa chinensis]